MSADIEHEVAGLNKAAIEPIHRRRALPVSIINAKRPDGGARGPDSGQHPIIPSQARPAEPAGGSRATLGAVTPRALRSPPEVVRCQCARRSGQAEAMRT